MIKPVNLIFITISILLLLFLLYTLYQKKSHFSRKKEEFGIFDFTRNKPSNETASMETKKILVTCATSHFGKDLVMNLATSNCKLFITGKDQKKIDALITQLQKKNKNVWGKAANFESKKEVEAMFKSAIQSMKGVNTLINLPVPCNNSRSIKKIEFEEWQQHFTNNINSLLLLNKLALDHMRNKGDGKIINVSSYKVKLDNTTIAPGNEIISDHIVEKYSRLLSADSFHDGVAVTTIRLDEELSKGQYMSDSIPLKVPESAKSIIKSLDSITKMLSDNTEHVIPIFIYIIKAPFHEINGKIIGTKTFKNRKNLYPIIRPSELQLENEIYNRIVHTSNIPGATYLVKQNPYGGPPSLKNKIQNELSEKLDGVNHYTRYDGKLLEKLIDLHKVKKNNILIFKDEESACKKIFDIFIGRHQDIQAEFPQWSYFFQLTKETKSNTGYGLLKMDESKGTVKLQLDSLLKSVHSNTKCIYLSSPNTVSGQSITKDDFKDFLTKVPDNVIIYLDQRYYEFSSNKTGVNGRDFIHINPNLIVQRSFNNFYGIKDLSLSYLMCSPKLFNFVSKTMNVNIVDDYQEMLALSCLEDITYYNRIKKKMKDETNRIQKLYKKKNMKTIPTETNYFLVKTTRNVDTIRNMLEKQNIVLYQSLDSYNDYWTLPISEPHINTKVMNLILYGV